MERFILVATPNGATSDTTGEATFDFGDQRITGFQNLQINIFLSSNQASATNVVSVNGVDITNECHQAGNNTWTTVDLGNKFTCKLLYLCWWIYN